MKQGSEIYHGKIERDKIQLKLSIAIFFFFFVKPVDCNLCYNILQLCNVLILLWLATSKTNLYLKTTKTYIKIASQVAKQIETWDPGTTINFSKTLKLVKVLTH